MANEFKAKNGVITPKIETTVTTGTPPLVVASATKVANLNADMVDGYDSSLTDTANTIAVRNSSKNIATTGIEFTTDFGTSVVRWNGAEGTFDFPLKNGTTLNVGQEMHFYGKASATINNGQLVMFTGISGDDATFAPADYAVYSSNPQLIVGVATNDITVGNYGYITWFGKVHALNTSSYVTGDILYADPTIVGGLTKTAPSAPYEKITVAAVMKVDSTNGILLIRVDFGKVLSKLGDVGFSTLSDKDLIMWNASASKWINVAQSTIDAGTALKLKNARTINGVSFDGTANISITSNTTNSLTIGNGLSGTSFNGSSPVTIAIDSTVVTVSGTQTLTGKTISGSSNTLSDIQNSSLVNSSISINGSNVSLGGSVSNLALTTGKLNQFATTSSAELASIISDDTGTGSLVFGTSPTFTTSINASGSSFDLLNTTATTVNAFGASTAITIGANTGYVLFNNATDSVSTTTGGLLTSGGIGVVKNANIGGVLYVGNNAYTTSFTSPAIIARSSGSEFTQSAIINTTSTGSSDLVAYADNGTDVSGWADMGVTGSNFSDSSYTITGKNDGYFFVKSVNGSGLQGNMVLATSGEGTLNDIIFATGGFLSSNEKARLIGSTGQFDIKTDIPSTSTSTGTLRVRGGTGISGNLNVGGVTNLGSSATISTTLNVGSDINVGNDVNIVGAAINTTSNTFNIVNSANVINFGTAANSITIGSSTSTVTMNQNLTVTGNLSVLGNVVTTNTTDASYVDSIIDLHNTEDGSPLTSDDGKDVGIRYHYYKTSDKHAGLILANDSLCMEFYVDGQESNGVFSGQYGTFKGASYIATANVSINGSTSGTTTLISSAIADTTVLTLPTGTDVLIGRNTTDTLTNKTLTTPVISTIDNGGLITLPTGTHTIIGRDTTDTLTNKTFDTAATGNVLKINNVQILDVTGSGKVVLQSSPSLVTPSVDGSGVYFNGSVSGTTTLKASASAGSTVITLPAVTGTVVTTGDTGSITAAMLAGSIPNNKLTNSSITIGSTSVSLGSTSTTLSGLSSVTATTFIGSLNGNADTVTNGVYTSGSYSDPSWLTLSKSKIGLSNVENTTLSTWAGTSNISTVGTISSGTWSGSFGSVSGANLTNITAGNLVGTIPSSVLGNSSIYLGTTQIYLNRSSANQALTGISSITLPGSTSGTVVVQPSAVSGSTTLILPATTGTLALVGDIKDATLTLSVGSAGATNTTVTVATGTGFSANSTNNVTYQLSVGPSLTNLATIMTNGSTGILKKTGVDTYVLDTSTYLTSSTAVTSFSAGTTGLTPSTATNGVVTLGGTLTIGNGGTGQSSKTSAFDALSPLSTLGDTVYHDGTNNVRLAGNISTTRKFLKQVGSGSISANPEWDVVTKTDVGLSNVDNTSDSSKSVASAAILTTSRTIGMTGDVTWTSPSFNGSSDVTGTATLAASGITAGEYTKITVDSKGRAVSGTTLSASDIPFLDASKISSGVLDSARLPSYVDDVLEYTNLSSFPVTGETGKIYVALDTNKTYRWSGSTYVYITSGAVDSVAGKTGVVILDKSDVGLGNVENTTLSTWSGSSNITTVGTVSSGVWSGTAIALNKLSASTISGISLGNNLNSLSAGSGLSGTSYNGSSTQTWTLASAYGDTINPYASKTANLFLASPNGSAGTPSFRSIDASDIPTLNQNTTGSSGSVLNSVTFNGSGTGDTSGTIFNGSAARTISYNTVGAPSTSGVNASGTWGINVTGTSSNITSYTINQNLGTSNSVTFDQVLSSNNGNGTNFKLGDDGWIGDINVANTIMVKGVQDTTKGYIVFGDGDATALGRTGTGTLTYGGNALLHAANFGSYAPSLTGTGASGVWGISVSGNASTATNIASGSANLIPYQTGSGTTGFISAPTTASTTLTWDGSAFVWATASSGGSISVSNDISTNATRYIMLGDITSGTLSAVTVSSTKLYFNPSSGTISATSFNSLSDATLKENVKTISSTEVLSLINPVEFNWIDTGIKSYGVIAQEIEQILPEAVESNADGIKSVNYIQLIPFLVKAVQDLQKEVTRLKANNDTK